MNLRPILTLSLAATAALLPSLRAGDTDEAVAISAKRSSDYLRERLPDGSPKPETFAFAKGGVWRSTEAATKDEVDFMEVARTMARPLSTEGFVASKDPHDTKLLIVVYWGTTTTPDHPTDSVGSEGLQIANEAAMSANHPYTAQVKGNDAWGPIPMIQQSTIGYAVRTPEQMDQDNTFTSALAEVAAENSRRDRVDLQNALLLGYDSWWESTAEGRGTALELRRQDLVDEIEAPRYFVVLMAYDFQLMWKEKKHKLLWETRFSVRERGDNIATHLAAMADAAKTYFGRNTGTLIRSPLPEGNVKVGPIKELAADLSSKE